MQPISPKAFALITSFEGLDQPANFPGGPSGVTIGIGYDLGFVTAAQLASDWGAFLAPGEIARLQKVVGLTGDKAKAQCAQFADIHIKREDALAVFRNKTIPKEQRLTEQTFPGVDQLPLDAQGALVSLIYNRGAKMDGDSRREMRAIRDAVPRKDLKEIAAQLRSMKRLWIGKHLDGLIKRREAEAQLVESAITHP